MMCVASTSTSTGLGAASGVAGASGGMGHQLPDTHDSFSVRHKPLKKRGLSKFYASKSQSFTSLELALSTQFGESATALAKRPSSQDLVRQATGGKPGAGLRGSTSPPRRQRTSGPHATVNVTFQQPRHQQQQHHQRGPHQLQLRHRHTSCCLLRQHDEEEEEVQEDQLRGGGGGCATLFQDEEEHEHDDQELHVLEHSLTSSSSEQLRGNCQMSGVDSCSDRPRLLQLGGGGGVKAGGGSGGVFSLAPLGRPPLPPSPDCSARHGGSGSACSSQHHHQHPYQQLQPPQHLAAAAAHHLPTTSLYHQQQYGAQGGGHEAAGLPPGEQQQGYLGHSPLSAPAAAASQSLLADACFCPWLLRSTDELCAALQHSATLAVHHQHQQQPQHQQHPQHPHQHQHNNSTSTLGSSSSQVSLPPGQHQQGGSHMGSAAAAGLGHLNVESGLGSGGDLCHNHMAPQRGVLGQGGQVLELRTVSPPLQQHLQGGLGQGGGGGEHDAMVQEANCCEMPERWQQEVLQCAQHLHQHHHHLLGLMQEPQHC